MRLCHGDATEMLACDKVPLRCRPLHPHPDPTSRVACCANNSSNPTEDNSSNPTEDCPCLPPGWRLPPANSFHASRGASADAHTLSGISRTCTQDGGRATCPRNKCARRECGERRSSGDVRRRWAVPTSRGLRAESAGAPAAAFGPRARAPMQACDTDSIGRKALQATRQIKQRSLGRVLAVQPAAC